MRPVLATVTFGVGKALPDPEVWQEARMILVDWQIRGKAQIVQDGAPLDIATLATMGAAAELVGATLEVYDEGVVAAWSAHET